MTPEAQAKLQKRADDLTAWLADNAPYCDRDQKHLDANTPERAYWHYGYLIAVRDVLKLMGSESVDGRKN